MPILQQPLQIRSDTVASVAVCSCSFVMMYEARKATAVEFAEAIFDEAEARMGPVKRNPGPTIKVIP